MINFCTAGLAMIESNKPSSDGYSVSNLLSVNAEKRGFLVESFVKPPVEVLLKFCCNVNIVRIKVNCAVGSQKSKVIHVISGTSHGESLTAKGSLELNEKYLVFHKRCSQKDNLGKHEPFYNIKNLNNVKYLIVKIMYTEGSTVPALGGLEVWGFLSADVPKLMANSVMKVWQSIQHPTNNYKKSVSVETQFNTTQQKEIEPFKIPEEFLDPITCNIFTIPMMLPSGKVVDNVTLEKFYKAEEQWGRVPSDPYTGVTFTHVSKPVVAISLKERLDKFLMDNCNVPVLKNIPRTVGNGTSKINLQMESSCGNHKASDLGKRKVTDIDSLLEQSLTGYPTFLEKPAKRQKVECMKCHKAEVLFKLICEHFVCRFCLVAMDRTQENKCICDNKISFNDAIRYHIKFDSADCNSII